MGINQLVLIALIPTSTPRISTLILDAWRIVQNEAKKSMGAIMGAKWGRKIRKTKTLQNIIKAIKLH
jgi:hypothetical protein